MKRVILLVLFSLFMVQLHAQSVTISGHIVDVQQKPVEAANIIVKSLPDSTFITGTATYDGFFEVAIDEPTGKFVEISSLGYSDTHLGLESISANHDFGQIELEESAIELVEATVVAKVPLFEQKNGILNINVENTALSSSGTAIDVLRSTPGLFLSRDDDVQMFGKGKVTIYMDGQEVQSMDIIKNLNSEEIAKIEVIRNPSAKYDAAGQGGVINIVTKNSRLEGLLGNITMHTTRATYQRGYIQTDLSYKKGKWGLFSSLDWNPYKVYSYEEFYRRVQSDEKVYTLNNEINEDNTSWLNNNLNLKVNYALTKQQTISAGFRGRFWKVDKSRTNDNVILEDVNQLEEITSNSNGHLESYYTIADLKYRWADTLGRTLTVSGSRTGYNTDNEDFIDEKLTSSEVLNRKSNAHSGIEILIGKFDYEQPLFNQFLNAEVGMKYANASNDSKTDFYSLNDNQEWQSTGVINDDIDYKENTSAAYLNLAKEYGKWNFRAGVRLERSDAIANSALSGNYYDTTYTNVFSSANIEYRFTDEIVADLSYSKRIDRPSYWDLNPFVNYLDSFSILRGNPGLVPELINQIEFNGSYSGYPLLTLGYSFTENPIDIVVESNPDNPLINEGISKNLEYERKYHGQIILPYKTDWWISGNGFGYAKRFVKDDQFNNGELFSKDEKYIFSYQDFNFGDWNIGAQYTWFSPGLEGIFQYSSGSVLNFWMGKKMLDGKLSMRFQFNDILKSQIVTSDATIGNLYIRQRGYYDSRRARIILKYKFGKLQSKVDSKIETGEEFNRIKLD